MPLLPRAVQRGLQSAGRLRICPGCVSQRLRVHLWDGLCPLHDLPLHERRRGRDGPASVRLQRQRGRLQQALAGPGDPLVVRALPVVLSAAPRLPLGRHPLRPLRRAAQAACLTFGGPLARTARWWPQAQKRIPLPPLRAEHNEQRQASVGRQAEAVAAITAIAASFLQLGAVAQLGCSPASDSAVFNAINWQEGTAERLRTLAVLGFIHDDSLRTHFCKLITKKYWLFHQIYGILKISKSGQGNVFLINGKKTMFSHCWDEKIVSMQKHSFFKSGERRMRKKQFSLKISLPKWAWGSILVSFRYTPFELP